MSILDGPGEGTWSVFAMKVVEERDELRHKLAGEAAHIKSLEGLLVDAADERDKWRTRATFAEKELSDAFGLPPTLGPSEGEAKRIVERLRGERSRIIAYIHARLAHATMDDRVSFKERGVMIDLANAIEGGEHER